ncbi:MAG: hypothetical protein HC918_07605 [Oscillatoriales cyanobacterium SM2_1_8]|nr:hypothetical protein [Oscillatoriales cyanobacterium SM2_1_8]
MNEEANEPILEETLSSLEEIQDDENLDLEASLNELAEAAEATENTEEAPVPVGEAPPLTVDTSALLREAATREIEGLQKKIETLVADTVNLKSTLKNGKGNTPASTPTSRTSANAPNGKKKKKRIGSPAGS